MNESINWDMSGNTSKINLTTLEYKLPLNKTKDHLLCRIHPVSIRILNHNHKQQ